MDGGRGVGRMVEFPSNGHTCSGYLATPPSGSGPGVVVIQEWWGLVDHIRDVCDRFAAEGFSAIAADLYHGDTIGYQEPDEAGKRMMAMRIEDAARDLGGAVAYLRHSGAATGDGVGSVGFCLGGGLSLYLASINPAVSACVVYYGVIPWPDVQPDLKGVRAAVLGHWGEQDEWNTHDKVDKLEADLRAEQKKVEFFWYPAGHAFFNDARPEAHDADSTQRSWERTLAFLRQQLGA